MNDDLKLLITILTSSDNMSSIVLVIPHGMNDEFWSSNWKYYNEPEVFEAYKKLLPLHCQTFMKKILNVSDDIFEVVVKS